MSNAMILLSSATWAIRAQRLLEQRGIRSYIIKSAGAGGCGYGLKIRGDIGAAINYLKAADIRFKEI